MMMKCHEARRHLDLFLDGELDVEANMSVLSHLNLCATCNRLFEGEKRLRQVIAEHCRREEVPPSLQGKISARLERVEKRRPIPAVALAMAASILLALLFALMVQVPQQVSAEELVREAVQLHQKLHSPGNIAFVDVSTEPDLKGYLLKEAKAEPGLGVCLHNLSDLDYSYEQATVCDFHRGQKAFWSIEHNTTWGTHISHIVVAKNALNLPFSHPGAMKIYHYKEYTVVLRQCKKNWCIFVIEDKGDAERIERKLAMS